MIDDPDLTRRQWLSVAVLGGGAVAGALARQELDGDDGALIAGGGSRTIREAFGDWDLILTDDWDTAEIDRYPTVIIHSADGIRVFTGDLTSPLRTQGELMEFHITDDYDSVDIRTFPAIVFNTSVPETKTFTGGA